MRNDSGKQTPEHNRLSRLLEVARDYRGWSRRELADALNRDVSKLIPGSGNPKMDYVFKLAEVLDWSVGDVTEVLFSEDGREELSRIHLHEVEHNNKDGSKADPISSMNYIEADTASRQAWNNGEYKRSVRLARQAVRAAPTSEQRATAHVLESLAWETLGRYTKSLEALRWALRESPVSPLMRRKIQGNLSNIYYSLWHLDEARALSGELIHNFSRELPDNVYDRSTSAYVNYIHGHVLRRALGTQEDKVDIRLAEKAIGHLHFAIESYEALMQECDHPSLEGIKHECNSGLIELEVLAGQRTPENAVAVIESNLERLVKVQDRMPNHILEHYGWMCIYGCNIALRGMSGSRQQRVMAIFTNKGYEIADRIDSWAIRERVFTMEFFRRQRLTEMSGGVEADWLIDQSEVRIISGTMGRFPSFRPVGWSILEQAEVVRGRN